MSLRVLEETHKLIAVERLKGTPNHEILQRFDIARTQLYDLLKEPLFQEYYATLQAEARAARERMLEPVTRKMATAMEALVDRMLEMIKDPNTRFVDPGKVLEDLVRGYAALTAIQRRDSGEPADERRADFPAPRTGRRTGRILDKGLDGTEDVGQMLKALSASTRPEE